MSHPLLYQINTRCWLKELSAQHHRAITLATVPEEEFAGWKKSGFTHVWLMGVWTTGPHAREIARNHPDLRRDYDTVLPGWTAADVAGSPYSIADYVVPKALGGDEGLKKFRAKLNQLGLKLILDFVPNHLGLDHAWVSAQPELFVLSPKEADGTFAVKTAAGPRWIANGKDPYFAPWTDVAQLDYRRVATRTAMRKLLVSIAAKCDGVRCDMAMLMLNEVFAKTWAHLPTEAPNLANEFWPDAIKEAKQAQPGFIFMAEVYWGLEGRLQTLGFDFTYDKALYDDLIERHHAEAQRKLLTHPPDYVTRSIHFLENHDEPRVAAKLSPSENRAAALAILGLPGMRFLHEGQLTGARIKMPVQLGRRPIEPEQVEIKAAYEKLLAVLQKSLVGQGRGQILAPRPAWDGNPTHQNFIVVQWPGNGLEFDLVVVNLAWHPGQCYAPLTVAGLAERHWALRDLLSDQSFERVGSDLAQQGLYLDLPGLGAQLFRFEPKP
jgi:hypothetical protein